MESSADRDGCTIHGNSDMYGLGIRIGFYLQWYSAILASFLAADEINGLRASNSVFMAATFLALLIQTTAAVTPARDAEEDGLRPVEIYIIALLTFGSQLYLIPVCLWKVVVRVVGHEFSLDPTLWPRRKPGKLFSFLSYLLVLAVAAFQVWFWTDGVAVESTDDGCVAYGFAFTKVRLDSPGFRVVNILIYCVMLVDCAVILLRSACWHLGKILHFSDGYFSFIASMGLPRREDPNKISTARKIILQNLESALRLIVAIVVTTATELTIRWNAIDNVHSLSSAGQIIPFLVGLAALGRIFYVRLLLEFPEKKPPPSDKPAIVIPDPYPCAAYPLTLPVLPGDRPLPWIGGGDLEGGGEPGILKGETDQ